MKCPKCGSEMESWTEDSDMGKLAGGLAGAYAGFALGGPLGAGIGFFLSKRLGSVAGGKLFGDKHYYCPKCSKNK